MCGIAGAFLSVTRRECEILMARSLEAMQHRGPDGHGISSQDEGGRTLCLGHKRLAIIDLSEAGHQPMVSPCKRYAITFNGEIYNYVELREELRQFGSEFHTETDTEVLLAAWIKWGPDCLGRLDGMFAFAVHDRVDHVLHCAVDPFGIKPLYYQRDGFEFRFASEIPALLKLNSRPAALDAERSFAYLVWGTHDVGENTFVRDVVRLQPGHLLTFDLTARREPMLRRWWTPRLVRNDTISFDDAAEQLRALFLSSVKRQLRSDVPIGFALSGGLDSSSIVCAVRYLEPDYPIRTFSYLASNEALNERKWAELVVEHVDATTNWVEDSADDFDLESAMLSQGEPFGSTSILAGFHVFKRMKREGVVVSLDGQGADEALGGYDGYPVAVLREILETRSPVAALQYLRNWSRWPGRGGRTALMVLGDLLVPDGMRRHALHLAGYDAIPRWINQSALEAQGVPMTVQSGIGTRPENVGRRLAERLEIALIDNGLPRLLRYADRNAMRFSIESRVPFLSPDLAAFTLTLPSNYLVSPEGQTKHLFRAAMRGIVPEAILTRRDKIGFETPEVRLLNRHRAQIEEWIEAATSVPFLKADEVRKTVNNYLDGSIAYKTRCWRLINFCRWRSHMGSDFE